MKIKGQITKDVRIKDAVEGTGKFEGTLGSLLCDFDGVEVSVGGGFSDDLRSKIGPCIKTT